MGDIRSLPKNRPWLVSDLDGTLTRGGQKLLMEAFVEANPEVGNSVIRNKLCELFREWHDEKITPEKYDAHLAAMGNRWSEMLYAAKMTRTNVMETAGNWFRKDGHKKIKPCAIPMMTEADKFRFNRMLLTGAPGEIAYPFAVEMKFPHVVAMMAPVNGKGAYCDSEIFTDENTGVQAMKTDVCVELVKNKALALGLGDTLSDAGIALPAIEKSHANPDDLFGRFLLMNPRPDVEQAMRTALGMYTRRGAIKIIRSDDDVEHAKNTLRQAIYEVFHYNHKMDLYYEMIGVRRLSDQEIEEAKARRNALENEWQI
ncbi:hypothetical protein JXD20_01660 [Candidatus Peregrinibacteria bacterium]|nr:hypothetical protein [Candidatus Peregrinibacteria bacterium]